MILLIMSILIIIIFLMIKFKGNNFVESFEINHLDRYLDNIHPQQYNVKVKNKNGVHSKAEFVKIYKKCIKPIPNKYYDMLNSYTQKIDSIFKKKNLDNLIKPWEFKISENLEGKMPYTFSNCIVIDKNHINDEFDEYKLSGINKFFLELLIHEKTHIIQRNNQLRFDEYYFINYPFVYSKFPCENLPDKLKKIYMTNPDSNFHMWKYKYRNIIFYPLLVGTDKRFKECGFKCDTLEELNMSIIKKHYDINHKASFYHPNEVFACQFSENILNNNIDYSIIQLVNSLEF